MIFRPLLQWSLSLIQNTAKEREKKRGDEFEIGWGRVFKLSCLLQRSPGEHRSKSLPSNLYGSFWKFLYFVRFSSRRILMLQFAWYNLPGITCRHQNLALTEEVNQAKYGLVLAPAMLSSIGRSWLVHSLANVSSLLPSTKLLNLKLVQKNCVVQSADDSLRFSRQIPIRLCNETFLDQNCALVLWIVRQNSSIKFGLKINCSEQRPTHPLLNTTQTL